MSLSKVKALDPPVASVDNSEEKTIGDLAPEVLTKILELLTLGENRNTTLRYRLVNSRWKDILDSLLEKEVVSGRLQFFPVLKISGQSSDLHVNYLPAMFRAGENPFPSNSLLLTPACHSPAEIQTMAAPDFMSAFGGNLTSFALHGVIITDMNTVVAILGFMPKLKVLSIMDVYSHVSDTTILPTPPPLPRLTTLKVKTTQFHRSKFRILYVWLIVSYADQLASLELDVDKVTQLDASFPPLQQRHVYSLDLPGGNNICIATTSHSAFGKLNELKVSRPTRDFLRFTETHKLKSLSISITDFDRVHYRQRIDFRNLVQLLERCQGTLENLRLDVKWDALLISQNAQPDSRVEVQKPASVESTKLKTFAVHYPACYFSEKMLIQMVLVMFPALEVLQFLQVSFEEEENNEGRVEGLTKAIDFVPVDDHESEIVALKERLVSLEHDVVAKCWSFQEQAEIARREGDRDHDLKLMLKIVNVEVPAQRVRAQISKRLAALGDNAGEVLVEQLLKRQRIWNTCPNLKIVSVSSGRNPDGDICIIRRTDDA